MKKYLLAVALLASASGASAANIITNGNFETGSLSGWTNAGGSPYGQFNATNNGSYPNFQINANGGATHAMSSQYGPGLEALVQSFTVSGGSQTLSFDWFNQTFYPHTGSNLTGSQTSRVDILTANAAANDTGAGVVMNLLLNQTSTSWESELFNLSLAAGTYQLRFASYECCSNQYFSFDNVVLEEASAEVPEPAMLALFGLGAMALGLGRRRRKAA